MQRSAGADCDSWGSGVHSPQHRRPIMGTSAGEMVLDPDDSIPDVRQTRNQIVLHPCRAACVLRVVSSYLLDEWPIWDRLCKQGGPMIDGIRCSAAGVDQRTHRRLSDACERLEIRSVYPTWVLTSAKIGRNRALGRGNFCAFVQRDQ